MKNKKLLILTQKMDKDDPVLGFFHGWVEQLSYEVSHITVVCLEKEKHSGILPTSPELRGANKNIRILSLGKEEGKGKLTRVYRLFKYAWQERHSYETVFVHMNQEYVLLAGLLWKFLGKKILLWRNHSEGSIFTRLAVGLSDKVYCTSSDSYTAQFEKTKLMPAGIDTHHYKKLDMVKTLPHSILSLGRISPVKQIDILIDAIELLWEKDVAFKASIVGDPPRGSESYYKQIRKQSERLENDGVVRFFEGVPPAATPDIYNAHEIYVNLTSTGSFDKTIAEAMACERPIIIANTSLRALIPGHFQEFVFFHENDPEDLAHKIKAILMLPNAKKIEMGKALREAILKNQSLEKLIIQLIQDF